ncbi:hypothetical protein EBZ39_15145, partial [bacterium]|nr:hypothetical protein [bacterium]
MLGRYFLVAALVVTSCAAKGPVAHKKAPERLEKTIVVVDTADREAWLYKPVFDMIKNLGYSVDYKPLDQVLDEDSIPRSAGVFFIFGTEFLSVLNKSHVCTKVLQLLHFAAQQTGTLVGLAFPSMRTTQGMNLVAACARIFDQLGVKTPPTAVEYPFPPMLAAIDEKASDDMAVRAFFYLTNIFLSTPLESRPLDFHTTLSLPRAQGIEFDVDQMKEVLQVHGCNLSLMPRLAVCSPVIKKTLPYGVYWYNHVRKNHVLVTTTNILSFAGITENFHVTPINVGLRIEMLQQVHRMLWETLVLSQLANKAAVTQAL